MMRRAKKLTKKPDPQEESSDDSGEEQTKPKKAKAKKATKIPESKSKNEDPEDVPAVVKKKGRANVKEKPSKAVEMDAESTERPKKITKKVNVKKLVKLNETEEQTAGDSTDEESTEKPQQIAKKVKALGKKRVKSVKLDEHDETASGESSDEESTEKPKQTAKKVKRLGKKPVKSVKLDKHDEEASGESSDGESTEKPKQTAKKVKALGKKPVKSVKLDKHDEEASAASSDYGKQLSKTVKREKRKKVLKKPDAAESSDESEEEKPQIKKKIKTKAKAGDTSNNSDTEEKLKVKDEKPKVKDDLSDGEISSDSGIKYDMEQYKKSMRSLKSIDPDFYKFLQVHDSELLNFEDHEKVLDEKEDDEKSEEIHVPGDKLHMDSDESDFEGDDAEPVQGKVTQQMITNLNNELIKKEGKMKLSTIILATKLFNGAVKRATSEDGNSEGEFKVAGSGIFNNIINMCVLYLPNGIKRYLGTDHSEKDPSKCKHFVKIKATLVQYLGDLMKLLTVVTSANILVVMLKHLHQMAPYVACFVRIAKKAIKTILPLWSSGEETVRVLAFVCILRITRSQRSEFLEIVLKAMYMTYVKNCKFVSPNTWPGINFMRRSLVEMFLLNVEVTYPIAFVYVRQLGIHLRNAIMVPKKENVQAIYNWQYLNSLHLWAQLIPQTMHLPQIRTLIFPLTMIISNTIKMKPTVQYYPLRFRLVEILIHMTRESGRFIPVHGYLLDVLMKFDFNKKSQKVSMKPMDLSCMIRLNKSQMSENSFKDAVAERLYALLLEYETDISCELSFPDATMILLIHLRDVVNKSTVPNFKRKFKQLHDKIEESAEFIRDIRYNNQMSLRDGNVVRAEQNRIKAAGTPLMAFYEKWNKVNMMQKRKAVTKNDQLAGEMPTIKRTKIAEEAQELFKDHSDGPVELFPSDTEDETDDFKTLVENEEEPSKDEAKQKMKKKRNNKEKLRKNETEIPDAVDDAADAEDIVKEFSAGDW